MATDNEYLQQQLINQDPYSLLDPESVYRNREALGATTPNIDETLGNIPSSAGQFASDIAGVVTNPVQTIDAISNLGLGLIALAIPDAYQEESLDKPQEAAVAVGQYFADRYGSEEAAMESFRTDPVGVTADISAILLGGGYLATRGGLKAGQVATQAGLATDPLIVAGRGVGELAGAVNRRDFMKGAGAGIGSLMLPMTNMLSDIKAPVAAAVKALNPARFLEKTKGMFDDIASQVDMFADMDPPFTTRYSATRKFDLNRSVKNTRLNEPSKVRIDMPKIRKVDDGQFQYDLDLEGNTLLDEDPYYMEKVAHKIELEHFKGSGFAPNELQVLDNLDGALYYTKNLDEYKSISPDKADPGSLKTYTPTDSGGYTVSTYTVDGVPVTRQRTPGNSQQAEFIEYTVPNRKAVKNKIGETQQQQNLDLPIDSAPTTSAKDIVQAVDDSMTPTEKMNAMLKEKIGDVEPDAPRAELTKAEQRIADLETQQYDVDNVINREGSNMSDVNLAKLKERKKNITDELDELKNPKDPRIDFVDDPELLDQLSVENQNDAMLAKLRSEGAIPVEEIERLNTLPPETQNSVLKTKTITRRDALKGMGATGIAALMGTGADIADVATTTTKTAKAAKAAKATINPTSFLNKFKEMYDGLKTKNSRTEGTYSLSTDEILGNKQTIDVGWSKYLPEDMTSGPMPKMRKINDVDYEVPIVGGKAGVDYGDYLNDVERKRNIIAIRHFEDAGFKKEDIINIEEDGAMFDLEQAGIDTSLPVKEDPGSLKEYIFKEPGGKASSEYLRTYTIDGVPMVEGGGTYGSMSGSYPYRLQLSEKALSK